MLQVSFQDLSKRNSIVIKATSVLLMNVYCSDQKQNKVDSLVLYIPSLKCTETNARDGLPLFPA